MTAESLENMMDEIGIECRYHHFETEEAVPPPFICWYFRETKSFFADGKNYAKILPLYIELYTDGKSIDTEKQIEDFFERNRLSHSKEEGWIETENMYMVLYQTEVVLHE